MIIRIFVALLALNMVAFVVRADAAERVFEDLNENLTTEDVYELQERMSGDFDRDPSEAVSALGSKLLTLSMTRRQDHGKRYASEPAQPDHGIAFLNEGACLNLKWNF
ncbi:hypothetical protein FWJ25_15525 [Marinobacter salinexigens]|uniref:DNA polymerase n=1 Tax=Marinobacter salinexigens TaxID=2919747 RepID=A0A5B0VBJ4_9GAMM|nr:hypothetical protein [Marinobacter salinexigens]KAA1172040.1 hypothetical protein FWJ25_15525 [Marinobacter salinexigens]